MSTFELEHRVLRTDGSLGWTFSRAIPLENGNGEIAEWFGAASDITKRKDTEQVLEESERQFRTPANAIPQLCWTAKADGWIDWYNERWYQYTGTTPEQMEGWGWQTVHDPEALPEVMVRWQSSIATGQPFDMVFPLRGADGVFRPFLTRVTPVLDRDGNVARWFGTNTDITEQRQGEEALRRSEEKLRLALDAASMGVWDWDILTGEHVWTDSCKLLFELSPDKAVSYETFLAAVHAEDRDRIDRAVRDAVASAAAYDEEMRVPLPGGAVRWVWHWPASCSAPSSGCTRQPNSLALESAWLQFSGLSIGMADGHGRRRNGGKAKPSISRLIRDEYRFKSHTTCRRQCERHRPNQAGARESSHCK
jgi:PAS domain S-box-containing protein